MADFSDPKFEAVRKNPSDEFAQYKLGENMADKVREIIEMSGELKEDGTIHLGEQYVTILGLSPFHVTENFVNVVVDRDTRPHD